MEKPRVRVYSDYKSPYAFVASAPLFALEEKEGVELEWLPYTLQIPEFMGAVAERTPHFWRKARYLYMDARRFANAQGLTLKGTKRIYDAFYSSAGMLFAQRHGLFPCAITTPFSSASQDQEWSSTSFRRSARWSKAAVARDANSRLTRTARRAPSTIASSTRRKHSACSARCRRWFSTAGTGAATALPC